MKVGIVANVPGHLRAFWRDLGDELESHGCEVFFASSGVLDDPRFTSLRGLTRRPSWRNVFGPAALRSWVRDCGIDVVITNTATPSLVSRFAGLPVPLIYFAHGLHWAEEKGMSYLLWSALERAALHKSDGMLLLNKEDYEWVARSGYSKPFARLEYGVGLRLEHYPLQPTSNKPCAVWVGEFIERKQPRLAIEAAAEIVCREPRFEMFMLGSGPLRDECISLSEELGLSSVVSFPGHVDPAPYYSDCSLLIHTATWEGLPRVALEAIASGRPVVALDAKGLRGVSGVSVTECRDVAELADLVERVLRDPERDISSIDRRSLSVSSAASELFDFINIVRAGFLR